jgi:integrase
MPPADFRAFAEDWWEEAEPLIAPATRRGYRWRLERHLLPYFAELPLDQITPDLIASYVADKRTGQAQLSASSINTTLALLARMLERAAERELIMRNPVRMRELRAPETRPQREHLEHAAQIEALLQGATELDHEAAPGARHVERRAMLATLMFAGLRIGELCALRWRDVDLAGGWLRVERAVAKEAPRRVSIRGVLIDELRAVRARNQQAAPDAFVFATRRGGSQDARNFRARVLLPAIERANLILAERAHPPLAQQITLRSLRRTFVTVLCALGEDPLVAIAELGQADPRPTLAVYEQALQLAQGERTRLRALVEGSQWIREQADTSVALAEARSRPPQS